ncbi:tRNA 2-selenouridine synthase [Algoriphagus alkaliphilus]|uniref:tRNA 2-selenouridine synthase n=1 Tax=Algoriphagus alkaliphilus TaxID=279824 RepID=A0A1G5WT68_9BACT|nr:tRNA 2-selenouridine(34) synthase MnmH [Algoriphagus alkaliphilus]MBA4301746.1 tRNA 2-selenouridine(34) synthase MnmH [Cyclobacterium sp.]SDA60916.1 tRNA 2-selenouridine synthase [Algoriphagus alkaliphilus]
MAEQLINLDEFWRLRKQLPILDARSEGEFAQSHIPGSNNLPILNNKERIVVGTLYKEKGAESATLRGFELVGPRFHEIQKEAIRLFPERKIIVYCWRGGMRSQILSWLLSMVGFEIYRLKGGYKTYRTFTFEEVRKERNLIVLGGKTGTAKTILLQKLRERGEQILDLEGIANHKGSSFGGIGLPPQPTVEQFENLLAENLSSLDPSIPTWVENESRKIGRLIVPDRLFEQMGNCLLIDIQKPLEERIKHIAAEYSQLPEEELIAGVKRIQKRLGGLRTQQAIEAIQEKNHELWISNLLIYYDKTYEFDLTRHEAGKTKIIDLSGNSIAEQVELLLKIKNQHYGN